MIFLFDFLIELIVLGHVLKIGARCRLRRQGVLLDEDALMRASLVGGDWLRAVERLSIWLTRLLLLLLTRALVEYLSALRPTESGIASSSHFERRLAHFNTLQLLVVVLYHWLIASSYDLLNLLRVPRLQRGGIARVLLEGLVAGHLVLCILLKHYLRCAILEVLGCLRSRLGHGTRVRESWM